MTESEVNPNEAPKRKRGRPKKVITPDLRAPMREEMREDVAFAWKPDEESDRLKVPKEIMADGMDYLWVTASIYGQAQPQRLARFQKQGWQPVPSNRQGFDGVFMPKGFTGQIEIDGLVLHERSMKISDMARNYERQKARGQIRTKEAQLLGGGMDVSLDASHQSAVRSNRISKSYEKIEIPEE